MAIKIIHRPKDFVSREIRLGAAAPSRPPAGRAGRLESDRAVQNHAVYGQPRISAERAAAARILGEAKRRAIERKTATSRAEAMIEARGEVSCALYVPEDGREDVVRIMVERGLSIGEAYEAWAAASPSLRVGSRGGRIGHNG